VFVKRIFLGLLYLGDLIKAISLSKVWLKLLDELQSVVSLFLGLVEVLAASQLHRSSGTLVQEDKEAFFC
jgi:hypothetical protein